MTVYSLFPERKPSMDYTAEVTAEGVLGMSYELDEAQILQALQGISVPP